jgi:hypothetical protein
MTAVSVRILRKITLVYRACAVVLAVTITAALRDLASSLIALCRGLARAVLEAAVAVFITVAHAVAARWSGREFRSRLSSRLFRCLLCGWLLRRGSGCHGKRRLLDRLVDSLLSRLLNFLLAADQQQRDQQCQNDKRVLQINHLVS